MPFPRTRLALTTVALVVLAALSAIGSLAPARAQTPTGNIIADTALKYLGTKQGQCWIFVQKVVKEAGYDIGFDYIYGFLDHGAVEIRPEEARAGDIIQIIDDDDHGPFADYPGMHTAIVLTNYGNGKYEVVDSNYDWTETVSRHDYDPFESVKRVHQQYPGRTLEVHFFRYPDDGAPNPRPAPTPVPAEPTDPTDWAPGDTAVVVTDGDCLNFRTAPSLGAENVRTADGRPICFRDGTRLSVLSSPTAGSGLLWLKVRTEDGREGWVAAQYLAKIDARPPASGGGSVEPPQDLPFRTFVPGLAADQLATSSLFAR